MIRIYNEKEIEILRRGGKILATIMRELEKEVRPGMATEHLNKVARDLVFSFGAEPSFEGFQGYPATLCTCINEEIVHAIPSERKLKQGDILSLDLGIRYKNYCTDLAITVPVGRVGKKIKKLIDVTKESLDIAITQCKPGNALENIGAAIEKYVKQQGFDVVRELCGHGVGKSVHEPPQILNYGEKGRRFELKQGMVLALEPMMAMGNYEIEKCEDGFGYRTKDRSLSCHFEHTIAITKNGPVVLTK